MKLSPFPETDEGGGKAKQPQGDRHHRQPTADTETVVEPLGPELRLGLHLPEGVFLLIDFGLLKKVAQLVVIARQRVFLTETQLLPDEEEQDGFFYCVLER